MWSSIQSSVGSASFSPPVLNFGNGAHVKDEELALYMLKKKSYDRKEAIKAYAKCLKGETKARDLEAVHEVVCVFNFFSRVHATL